ncbi:MAG: hypothetical protein SO150_03390 [Faecalicoccus sp.]|uniref:hypothetical protein n=1 Tax=Faecalicoccus sp. TaxID=1971758 RepID=UPI002A8299FF|nr:hypothetical protein [Faecalicoccus sp.]MDY4869370.1 hypothetical protein [Faecalicoccus sp.]MDY5232755.1 hypothetical protein [Faecalicoccus sp.]
MKNIIKIFKNYINESFCLALAKTEDGRVVLIEIDDKYQRIVGAVFVDQMNEVEFIQKVYHEITMDVLTKYYKNKDLPEVTELDIEIRKEILELYKPYNTQLPDKYQIWDIQ